MYNQEEFDAQKDACKVIIAITGTHAAIKRRLQEIIKQMDAPYGKPVQGTTLASDDRTEVITPVWDGKKY